VKIDKGRELRRTNWLYCVIHSRGKLYALGKDKRENIYPSLVSKSLNINLFIIFFFHFD